MGYPRMALVHGAWGFDPDLVWRLYVSTNVCFLDTRGKPNYRELFNYESEAPGLTGFGEPNGAVALRLSMLNVFQHNTRLNGKRYTVHNLGYVDDDGYPTMVLVSIQTTLINTDMDCFIALGDVYSYNPFAVDIIEKLKGLKID